MFRQIEVHEGCRLRGVYKRAGRPAHRVTLDVSCVVSLPSGRAGIIGIPVLEEGSDIQVPAGGWMLFLSDAFLPLRETGIEEGVQVTPVPGNLCVAAQGFSLSFAPVEEVGAKILGEVLEAGIVVPVSEILREEVYITVLA